MTDTILFFDTETDGLALDRFPAEHPDQPRIVQLAALLCHSDGKVISSMSQIIAVDLLKPIPKRASDVHGITDEISARFGISIDFALQMFAAMYGRADLVVAHNMKFDQKVMEAETFRYYKRPAPFTKSTFCTINACRKDGPA